MGSWSGRRQWGVRNLYLGPALKSSNSRALPTPSVSLCRSFWPPWPCSVNVLYRDVEALKDVS